MSELYLYLGVYVAILLLISFYISRGENSEGFLISNRNRSMWAIAASKFAGAIGAGIFVTYTAYSYEFGFGVYAVVLGLVIGYLLFAFWAAPRIYKNSREEKFYTMGDFVFHSTQNHTAKLATNIVSIVIIFSWLMTSIVGGVKIISHFGLMSYEMSILATTLVVMAYIFMAGFRAVMTTDIFQSIIILVLMVLVSSQIIGSVDLSEIMAVETGTVDIATVIGFLLFGILSVFSFSNWYQLTYAARSERDVKKGMAFALVPIIVITSLLLLIGLYMRLQDPSLDPGLVFIEALKSYLPVAFLPIGIVLFFAGLMSSSDTNIYAITSHYVFSKKSDNPVKDIRIATVILSVAMIAIAYLWRDVVDITIIAAGLSATLSVPMIYLIASKTNHLRFLGSVVGSCSGLLLGIAIFGISPEIMLVILAGGILGLFYKKRIKV